MSSTQNTLQVDITQLDRFRQAECGKQINRDLHLASMQVGSEIKKELETTETKKLNFVFS